MPKKRKRARRIRRAVVGARPIIYQQSVVTFLDVLGFRNLVKSRTASEVAEILALVYRSSGAEAPDKGRGYEPHVVVFSDSVVRVRPLDSQANRRVPLGLPFHELVDLLHIQAELMMKGVFVRGAVVLGDAAVASFQVFGPGVVEAYDLQTRDAKYPRIIVSPHLIRALEVDPRLKAAHHSQADEMEYVQGLLRKDDDCVWFLDYLRTIEGEVDGPEEYLFILATHRDMVRAGAKEALHITNTAGKYLWLAKYHNTTVENLSLDALRGYGIDREDLQLRPEDTTEGNPH